MSGRPISASEPDTPRGTVVVERRSMSWRSLAAMTSVDAGFETKSSTPRSKARWAVCRSVFAVRMTHVLSRPKPSFSASGGA